MENHFTSTFSKAFRHRQDKHSLVLFLLVLPVAFFVLLYISLFVYGGTAFYKYLAPGVLALVGLYLLVVHGRNRAWMNACYRLTENGIVLKTRGTKEQNIPWSSVVAVDVGKLEAYDNSEISVIRCHLSSVSSQRLSPNLRNSGNEKSIGTYYKLRNECFVLEYSPEQLTAITKRWKQVQKTGENSSSATSTAMSDADFEFAFDSDVRGSIVQIKGVYIIGYYLVIAICFAIRFLLKGISDDAMVLLIVLVGMPLVILCVVGSNQQAVQWLENSKCKLCQDGIYLLARKKLEFIPWDSIVAVERRQMNLDAVKSVYVICCYRSLTSKVLMEQSRTQSTLYPMYSEFYRVRDEVVTIGYSQKRMSRIRAWRGTSMRHKE